jgi:hypothetical protein
VTRRLTVLFAAFEALLVLALGVAIPLVPLTIVWAAHFGFAPDWVIFWRAAVDTWLIGHGVDVTFTLDADTAALLGLPGAGDAVRVTIALLGFALLTLLLGVRAGARVAETGHRILGELTALAVFAALSLGVTSTVLHPFARPSLWQGALFPTVVFGAGLLIGVLRSGRDRAPDAPGSSVRDWVDDWRPEVRAAVGGALRAGTAATAFTVLAGSIAVTVLMAVHFADIIRLYEALHTELVGGLALTAGQLALLPNLVIWAASWFIGPGFALGVGSQVSPLGTALGPIPAIPVLGALPTGDAAFAFAGLLVPVVAGFLSGAATRPRVARALDGQVPGTVGLGVALGGGVLGGLLFAFLAAASGGAAGPGRLAEVGPSPLAVGLAAAAEFAVAIGIGFAAARALPTRRPRRGGIRPPR